MDQFNGRISSHSNDSSRYSSLSNNMIGNKQTKIMQAKLLMDYYQANSNTKQKKYEEQIKDKYSYGNYQQSLTKNYLMQQQAKKRRKQQIRQKLAQQYDQMINLKQQKQKQQKQKLLQIQRKDLQINKWGRDHRQVIQKKKKLQSQYGKQLEMHIRLQQIRKYQDKLKQNQMIQKYQHQQANQNFSYDIGQLKQYKKRQQFENRQNALLGINKFNSNQNPQRNQSLQLEKNDFKALKRRQQMLHGIGLQHQLKYQASTTISPNNYNTMNLNQTQDSNYRNKSLSQNMYQSQVYNPITNPIQIKYKNPYVLRMLAQYG